MKGVGTGLLLPLKWKVLEQVLAAPEMGVSDQFFGSSKKLMSVELSNNLILPTAALSITLAAPP